MEVHFSLLNVGRRLVIKPSWIEYHPDAGQLVIELDPGMAFGTGYHPTTHMCLEALESYLSPGEDVLDLGTGSGILAIAASRLGAASVLALDVDPIAVKAARRNFRAAGLTGTARLARGTLPHQLAPEGHFDLAVTNISSKIAREKAPHLYQVVKPGGVLVVSGIVQDQQADLEESLTGTGFASMDTVRVDDWVALVMSRRQ